MSDAVAERIIGEEELPGIDDGQEERKVLRLAVARGFHDATGNLGANAYHGQGTEYAKATVLEARDWIHSKSDSPGSLRWCLALLGCDTEGMQQYLIERLPELEW